MRKLIVIACACMIAPSLLAQNHQSRFELSKDFVMRWSDSPVQDVGATILGASAVHRVEQDCEMHIGSEFTDPSFTDFPGVVLEPPNLCKFPKTPWRAKVNKLAQQDCTANGFVRAWPEHLDNGVLPSNPDHFMEVHPLLTLNCGPTSFDFTDKLKAYDDLDYKSTDIVNKMLDMQFWVCQGCSPNSAMLAFDYCFGDPCRPGHASNFARFEEVEILPDTIRPTAGASLDGVATVIARGTPKDSPSPRQRSLKLYAIKGTVFYDDLLAERGRSGDVPEWEILGIFTLDPFSIKRALEQNAREGEWVPIPHPVSLIVFGSL